VKAAASAPLGQHRLDPYRRPARLLVRELQDRVRLDPVRHGPVPVLQVGEAPPPVR
jgi:hypothetical protein